jgi:hypothetical protein
MNIKEKGFKRGIKSMIYRIDNGRGIVPDKSSEPGDNHAIMPV